MWTFAPGLSQCSSTYELISDREETTDLRRVDDICRRLLAKSVFMASNLGCLLCRELQPVLPYTTGCGHTFCYLCLKASFERVEKCPECHAGLSQDIYERAQMPTGISGTPTSGNPTWLYGGRNNGWWKYDPVSNQKLENGYNFYLNSLATSTAPEVKMAESTEKKERVIGSLIDFDSDSDDYAAPSLLKSNTAMSVAILNRTYSINFERMIQTPISSMGISRPIKRVDGTENVPVKGVAGLQIRDESTPSSPPPMHSLDSGTVALIVNAPIHPRVFTPDDM